MSKEPNRKGSTMAESKEMAVREKKELVPGRRRQSLAVTTSPLPTSTRRKRRYLS